MGDKDGKVNPELVELVEVGNQLPKNLRSSEQSSNNSLLLVHGDSPDSGHRSLGVTRTLIDGAGDFLLARIAGGSKRHSRPSSVVSEESRFSDRTPTTKEDLFRYLGDLVGHAKRADQVVETLQQSGWFDTVPDAAFDDFTLLHAACWKGEIKVVNAIINGQFRGGPAALDAPNGRGDTPLHLAAIANHSAVVDVLLKCGSGAANARNNLNRTPLQLAVQLNHKETVDVLLKHDAADVTVLTENNETLVVLACRHVLTNFLNIKDGLKVLIEGEADGDADADAGNYFFDVEEKMRREEKELLSCAFPTLLHLLDQFRNHPDLLRLEDDLRTSPGTALHYFASLNFVEGASVVLDEPFLLSPNALNKNGLSPLWIASYYNNTRLGTLLLDNGADANVQDPVTGLTPLHCAIYGYHADRVERTCEFVDALLSCGANPRHIDKAGETAPHLVVGTNDFKLIAKFLHHLGGPDVLDLRDECGNSLFHYAVESLDEHSIHRLVELGANVMARNHVELAPDDDQEELDFEPTLLRRCRRPSERLAVQEAIRSGNSTNYFNALMRMDMKKLRDKLGGGLFYDFLRTHLVAATREVRPDVVRLLFQQVTDRQKLHEILLFRDVCNRDETFTKTALDWAVENNDRLCTTEILHQEFECHNNDKVQGLNCLRTQLNSDELLPWTIETFTMFFDKTWAQRVLVPIFGLIPLFLSISTFVYDYYSDIELTLQYYDKAFSSGHNSAAAATANSSSSIFCNDGMHFVNDTHVVLPVTKLNCTTSGGVTVQDARHFSPSSSNRCVDLVRTPEEFTTAFVTNIVCVALPMLISYTMCSRELVNHAVTVRNACLRYLVCALCVFPVGVVCAPLFVPYVAGRHVYFKFKHRRATRKSKIRRQLQKSEYYWGILRTSEAGLESCGQLTLQVWLLSSSFNSLSRDHFADIVDKTYNGVIFFLSFSIKDADEIEKSLGKLFMSLIALVLGVSACYRTLKRGSVRMNSAFFIYLSLFTQIFARMFSFGLYFFTIRSFFPNVLVLVGVHFLLMAVLKLAFERTLHSSGMASRIVAAINILASSVVYVRIVPIEKAHADRSGVGTFQQHSTCFVQTVFFLLVTLENLLLAATPLLVEDRTNRALECLGREKVVEYVGVVFALCLFSWIFHALYYKYLGHPWADINGPQIDGSSAAVSIHHMGKESVLRIACCSPAAGGSGDVEEESKMNVAVRESSGCCYISLESAETETPCDPELRDDDDDRHNLVG